ncbi:MAG TPA: heme-degrading domain-containing protein [Ktedonobacterales bacterium]|nr:heme-degrading domain-containing protein [Ktedonobacterales bacterium]
MAETDRTLEELLLRQEELLQFAEFSNETACALGLSLVDLARREGKAVTVDVRRNGHQLFHYALPGTSPDNDHWIIRKARVVNRFGHSSYYMGRRYASRNTTIQESALLDPTRYAAHGGAFPIIVRGTGPVGVVTVSGLPQQEDHDLVVRTLAAFLGVVLES